MSETFELVLLGADFCPVIGAPVYVGAGYERACELAVQAAASMVDQGQDGGAAVFHDSVALFEAVSYFGEIGVYEGGRFQGVILVEAVH